MADMYVHTTMPYLLLKNLMLCMHVRALLSHYNIMTTNASIKLCSAPAHKQCAAKALGAEGS